MEIYKQTEPDRIFNWKDVTFHIRPRATTGDKHDLVMIGDIKADGRSSVPRSLMYRRAIELFVKSWNGVTENGKQVPFSMAALDSLPTSSDETDVILELGAFIYNHCVSNLPEDKKKV